MKAVFQELTTDTQNSLTLEIEKQANCLDESNTLLKENSEECKRIKKIIETLKLVTKVCIPSKKVDKA